MNQEELFDAYLRQELNEEELTQLLQRLEQEEDFKQDFFRYVEETSAMLQCAQDMQSEHLLPKEDDLKIATKAPNQKTKQAPKSNFVFDFRIITAIAAILVCGFIILNKEGFSPEKLTYRITEAQAKNFTLSPISPQERIVLEENESLRLINESGSRIQLVGPIHAQFIHDKNVILKSGRITLSLSEEDQGFLLSNSIKDIRDIGTAFGAHLRNKDLDLHVFDGLVEFGTNNKILVKEKESYTYSSKSGFSSIPHLSEQVFASNAQINPLLEFKVLAGENYFLKLNENTSTLQGTINILNYNPKNPKLMLQIFADDEFIQGVQFTKKQKEIQIKLNDLDKARMLRFHIDGSNHDIPTLFAQISFSQNDALEPLQASQVLISDKAQWHFYKDEIAPQEDWKTSSQAPANWQKSQASFGYSDKASTELKLDDHPLHVRHEFELQRLPNKMAKLILSARVDDGAIFYLNGVELQRTHLPDGPLDQSSRANSRTKSEKKFTTFILPVNQLKQGHNILSASVYQFEKKSTDMFFNARLLLLE